MKLATALLVPTILIAAMLTARPAAAAGESITGYVTDGLTGGVMAGVCVTLGPPIACWTKTDGNGFYSIDLAALAAQPGSTWDMYFIKTGYQQAYSGTFQVTGPVRFNQVLMPDGQRALCPSADTRSPTQTVYLPNVTKTLGGAAGWYTPFIVQNVGTTTAALEVTYYRFLNGVCAVRRSVASVAPGTSFADVPNNDTDLPGDTQFAVVVRSFGSDIVAVVNEHAGAAERAEAMSYTGTSTGTASVFLPNVVRRFFGFVTPFIIQNLGQGEAAVTIKLVSFDGTAPTVELTRRIAAGTSKFVDPNSDDTISGAPGLMDGKQYTATVRSAQPLSVVVNTHADAPGTAAPMAYSTNGVKGGASTVYGPYAAKNAQGSGRYSTIVVQNLGDTSISPTLSFLPLGGGTAQAFTSPTPVAAGGAWAFDPRFALGTTVPCSGTSAQCLGDGEYTLVANSGGAGTIAVAVNVFTATTAMGYTGIRAPSSTAYLPNVTRTLGGASGWTTPILLQSVGSTTQATLKWYRFSDGQLVLTQPVSLPRGGGVRVDPAAVSGLADDTQYAVVATATGGQIAAIVTELASGGDNAMIYEGFVK